MHMHGDTDMTLGNDQQACLKHDQISDEEEEEDIPWLLGFIEPPIRDTDLLRHRFPSKVGGRPAWLNPIHLPSIESVADMKFLLQVYAPVDENPRAFHRTVFVFISVDGKKVSQSPDGVRALRCQLPRRNEYYDFEPPDEGDDANRQGPRSIDTANTIRDPWNVAQHEQAVVAPGQQDAPCSVALFPEFEIVIEDEPIEDIPMESLRIKAEESNVSEKYTEEELPSDLVNQIEETMPEEQKHFASFAARTSLSPSQILRYCFEEGVKPLCPSPAGIPDPSSIPPCPHCQGPRRFEFQIMPQLLNSLDVDPSDDNSPDWGAIVIYSCAASCDVAGYVDEYVWVQPPYDCMTE